MILKPSPERRRIVAYLNRFAREIPYDRSKLADRYWIGFRDALKGASREIRKSYDVQCDLERFRKGKPR